MRHLLSKCRIRNLESQESSHSAVDLCQVFAWLCVYGVSSNAIIQCRVYISEWGLEGRLGDNADNRDERGSVWKAFWAGV